MQQKYMNKISNKKSLRLYFMGYLALMGFLLMLFFILFSTSREKEIILKANKEAGIILAENLASNCVYGFISADSSVLDNILLGARQQENVLYAEIKKTGKNPKVLAQYAIDEFKVREIDVSPDNTEGQNTIQGASLRIFEIVTPVKIVSYEIDEDMMFMEADALLPKKEVVTKNVGYVRIGWSLEKTYLQYERDKWLIVTITGILIIIFSIFYYLQLTKMVINPLKRFTEGAGVVEKGNLGFRFEIHDRDEIGELMEAFNRMADSIEVQQETILKHERLAAIGRTMASVAHEIRHGFQKILVKAEVIQTADRKAVSNIVKEILSMSEKMNSILKFTKTEKLNLQNTYALDIMDAVSHDFSNEVDAGRCKISVLRNMNPKIILDRSQLHVAISNLVRNSIDSCDVNGEITMSIDQNDNYVDFIVNDKGMGMDEETKRRAFEAFFTKKKRGYGLGLSIVETVALAHKGIVIINSEPGKGTEIRIRIPKSV